MIMMVLMIPMFVTFCGLVVDAGLIYTMKARLQNSADAAALAGAQGLPSEDNAEFLACENLNENAITEMTGSVDCGESEADITINGNTITVTTHREVPTLFVHFLREIVTDDNKQVPVEASATVKIGTPRQGCVFPFFLQHLNIDDLWELSVVGPDAAIDVGDGERGITEAMQDSGDCSVAATSKHVDLIDPEGPITLEGNQGAAFLKGWTARFLDSPGGYESCPGSLLANYRVVLPSGEYGLDPSLTPDNCPRLILMPILPEKTDKTPYKGTEKNVTVEGFGAFWVEDVCWTNGGCPDPLGGPGEVKKGVAWGYFVPYNVQSDTYTDYNGGGATVVVMID
jgi:hypothetical protein